MPIETANFVTQLDPTNPAAPDLLADTDNHLRMIKQVLKNSFPNVNGPVLGSHHQLNGYVPTRGIIMFSGTPAEVPAGWALCNGQTVARSDGSGSITTPNLTDRFIVGLNAAGTNLGATGGAVVHTGTAETGGAHSHTGNTDYAGQHAHTGATTYHAISVAEMPSHYHNYDGARAYGVDSGGHYVWVYGGLQFSTGTFQTDSQGGNQGHAHGIYADGNHYHASLAISTHGGHVHAVTIADGRPPFYALAFIMKV